MKLLTKGVFFLAGVAGIHASLVFGLHKAGDLYVERHPIGGRMDYRAVLLNLVTVSDFFTYKFWIAYPLLVIALLWLWLIRRKRQAGLKPFLKEFEPRAGVWPPAPKV